MAQTPRTRIFGVAATVLAAGGLLWGSARLARPDPGAPADRVELSLASTLGGPDTAGYERALVPRPFRFPEDHGAHLDFRTEWWYLTGNLEDAGGRRFGYQLTLFRSALAAAEPTGASPWRARDAWMGHFALTDVRGGAHHAFERFARGAVGLAGAELRPFRVWVEDWALEGSDSLFPLRVRAAEGDVALDLLLTPLSGSVLQGDAGLSRKGPEIGNASYYYSFPRLASEGTLRAGPERLEVRGVSWMDREWSTSALPEGVVGWDWFALQLDDGQSLMVYRLRKGDGSADPASEGTLTDAAGRTRRLGANDVQVVVERSWTSPVSGAEYPAGWSVRVPSAGLDLTVRPVLADQEMRLTFRYWEGAVDVTSRVGAGSHGRGYVELTGYASISLRR